MRLTSRLMALLAVAAHCFAATPAPNQKILMTYWSDDASRLAWYPVLGSASLQRQLGAINVLAYASLEVDGAGHIYFQRPDVDLSPADVRHFCLQQPLSCPKIGDASAGRFTAFANLSIIATRSGESFPSAERTVSVRSTTHWDIRIFSFNQPLPSFAPMGSTVSISILSLMLFLRCIRENNMRNSLQASDGY